MTKNNAYIGSYADQPCDRCGSKKRISKTWDEELKMSSGVSMVEVSQITCTNAECQRLFDEERALEVVKINERKSKKEEQDKIRRENIAKTIAARQKTLTPKAKKSKAKLN